MNEVTRLSKTMRIDLIPLSGEVRGPDVGQVRIDPSSANRPGEFEPADPGERTPYEGLLQSIYDAAVITDPSGVVCDFNQRALDFLQYPSSELRQHSIFDLISGADEDLLYSLRRHLETQRHALIQAYCIRRDGSLFPAEIAVNNLSLAATDHLCFMIRDTTVRRQTEEMLWTEHNAIHNSGSGIAVADLNANLEYANPAVARMWALPSADEAMGRDVRNLFADGERTQEMVAAVLSEGGTWSGQMTARRDDGTEFAVQVAAACNRVSEGDLAGIVLSFVDVSDRIRAEHATREAERQRVMLESLGAACHHLGQPATVLMGNLELMQDILADGKDDEIDERKELKRLVDRTLHAMKQMEGTLDRLHSVTEYKTTPYAESVSDGRDASSRIIEI